MCESSLWGRALRLAACTFHSSSSRRRCPGSPPSEARSPARRARSSAASARSPSGAKPVASSSVVRSAVGGPSKTPVVVSRSAPKRGLDSKSSARGELRRRKRSATRSRPRPRSRSRHPIPRRFVSRTPGLGQQPQPGEGNQRNWRHRSELADFRRSSIRDTSLAAGAGADENRRSYPVITELLRRATERVIAGMDSMASEDGGWEGKGC